MSEAGNQWSAHPLEAGEAAERGKRLIFGEVLLTASD
jgi:hypothetical protein